MRYKIIRRFATRRIHPLRFENPYYSSGYLKPVANVGYRPLNFFTGTPAETQYWSGGPVTVSNVEAYEKDQRHRREAEQENSGIVVGKEGWRKAMLKMQKQKQETEDRLNIIKYLAEQGEIDGIEIDRLPDDIRRGVRAYENLHHDELEVIRESQRQDRNSLNNEIKRLEREEAQLRSAGAGVFVPKRTKFVSMNMLRPAFEYAHVFTSPEEDVNVHEDLLEHRQTLYEDYQKKLRGQKPPKNMVERAMPKLVEPFSQIAFIKTPHGIVI